MKYTDLIFDLYGTLVDTRNDEGLDTWTRTAIYYGFYGAHYTGEELKTAFEDAMRQRYLDAGESQQCFPDVPCEDTFAQLFRDKGITENAVELGFHAAQVFRMISTTYLKLYPHVLESLAALRKAGYRLWLLSNAQQVFTAHELRCLGLDTRFDGIFLSSDYGYRKPDTRFFQALLRKHQLDISKCLMIGNDRRSDIQGATNAGLDTLYMHTNLTPPTQEQANADLLPGIAPADCRHYEFEGSDWSALTQLILSL